MSEVVVEKRFRGPPNQGNGGYVAGIIGREFKGPATAMIRAPVPLDTPLTIEKREDGDVAVMNGETMVLFGKAASADDLPDVPTPPSLEEARAAGARSPVLEQPIHPPCFSCSTLREEGDGLRVSNGQIEGREPGVSACIWTPHINFVGPDGQIPIEVIWAALDCSGSIAWKIKGSPVGLLGTMTGEVIGRPKVGEPHIVMAWPLENEGRRFFAGVALFTADGKLLARGRQIWIGRNPAGGAPAPRPR
jgi:hypothetical protein